uniref:Ricin B lectin domain-containing protein n=1 Tax=Plectus sambesii TaxID=2011161 RepID=A0A914V7X8_9BILA
MCFDVSRSSHHAPVVLFPCHNAQGNQEWRYRVDSKQLYHPVSGLCLDCDPERKEIYMSQCDDGIQSQKWIWQKMDANAVKKIQD